MTMPHIQWANQFGHTIAFLAELNDPDCLANQAAIFAAKPQCGLSTLAGRYAICSIAARAYWHQINGR